MLRVLTVIAVTNPLILTRLIEIRVKRNQLYFVEWNDRKQIKRGKTKILKIHIKKVSWEIKD